MKDIIIECEYNHDIIGNINKILKKGKIVKDKEFQEGIDEILKMIEIIPKKKRITLRDLIKDKKMSKKITKNNVKNIKDSLDNLRLMVLSLLHDLESTKRENLYLRKLLINRDNEGL